MRALIKFTFFCSLALLCGCMDGGRYAGEWQAVGGGDRQLAIAKVKGLEFTVALPGIGGRPQIMPGFLISNGALEVGGPNDIYFQYLVSDQDTGHLYLLQAMDMRSLSPGQRRTGDRQPSPWAAICGICPHKIEMIAHNAFRRSFASI